MHQFLHQFVVPHVRNSDYDQERSDLRGSRLESLLHQTILQSKGQPQKLRNQSGCQMVKFTLESSFAQNKTFSYMCTWGFCMRTHTWECMCTLTYTYNCEGHRETDLLHSQQFHCFKIIPLSNTITQYVSQLEC